LLAGDHVTDDAGTGFVHTAPGHGTDDYGMMIRNLAAFVKAAKGLENPLVGPPQLVDDDGYYYRHVPIFGGEKPKRVLTDKGEKGDANEAVIKALADAGMIIARTRLK